MTPRSISDLRSKRPRPSEALVSLIGALLVLLCVPGPSAYAQGPPPGFDELTSVVPSVFRSDDERLLDVIEQHGDVLVMTNRAAYVTSDRGVSWRPRERWSESRPPSPADDALVRYGRDGFMSVDGGATWNRVIVNSVDSSIDGALATRIMAWSSRSVFALVDDRVDFVDEATGLRRHVVVSRLVHSIDGGNSWSALDSLKAADGRYVDGITPAIGSSLPSRPGETAGLYRWRELLDVRGDSAQVVLEARRWNGRDTFLLRTYVCWIDLRARTIGATPMKNGVQWRQWEPSTGWRQTSPSTHFQWGPWPFSPVYRTTNNGETWEAFNTPEWIDKGALTYLSADTVVAPKGVTTDGGTTWRRIDAIWTDNTLEGAFHFVAFDARELLVIRDFSLVIRSTDGGYSWTRTSAGGPPVVSMIAHGDHVAISRGAQSVLVTDDGGVSWRDAYDVGWFPPDLYWIESLAYIDSSVSTDRIVGVGVFREGRRAIMTSSNGGLRWNVGADVTTITGDGPIDLQVRRATDGSSIAFLLSSNGLHASRDEGVTWLFVHASNLVSLAMTDAEFGLGALSTDDRTDAVVTTDGGASWRRILEGQSAPMDVPILDARSRGELRVLWPESPPSRERYMLRSVDEGATWEFIYRRGWQSEPKKATYHWLEGDRVIVVSGEGPTVLTSDDGLQSFERHTLPFAAQASATTATHAWVALQGTRVARWPIETPASITEEGTSELRVHRDGDRLYVAMPTEGAGGAHVSLIDLRGIAVRTGVATVSAGGSSVMLDMAGVAPGVYIVVVDRAGSRRAQVLSIAP